jgi:hypothetical protein
MLTTVRLTSDRLLGDLAARGGSPEEAEGYFRDVLALAEEIGMLMPVRLPPGRASESCLAGDVRPSTSGSLGLNGSRNTRWPTLAVHEHVRPPHSGKTISHASPSARQSKRMSPSSWPLIMRAITRVPKP